MFNLYWKLENQFFRFISAVQKCSGWVIRSKSSLRKIAGIILHSLWNIFSQSPRSVPTSASIKCASWVSVLCLLQRNGIMWTERGSRVVRERPGWLSELCCTFLFCSPLNANCPYLIPAGALRDGKGLAQRLWQMNRVVIRANFWEKFFSFSLLAQEIITL